MTYCIKNGLTNEIGTFVHMSLTAEVTVKQLGGIQAQNGLADHTGFADP